MRSPHHSVLVLILAWSGLAHAMDVKVTASLQSPQPLGTVISLTASASDDSGLGVWYRFRSRELGGSFEMIRDFGPVATLEWTTLRHEGLYEIEISAEDRGTGEEVTTGHFIQFLPRAFDQPVITPTAHPLVYLYSAPACPAGSRTRVRIQDPEGRIQQTRETECDGAYTFNDYVAGLRPNTAYTVQQIVATDSSASAGPALSLQTGDSPIQAPAITVVTAPASASPEGFILHCPIFPNKQFATDLAGNLVWYYPGDVSFITRPAPGGRFFAVVESPSDQSAQRFIEFDLAGTTVKETNAARVNQQLAARGARPISSFHHEARLLPDGKILALAAVEQMVVYPDSDEPVDVIADMIVVFDSNLQVVWAWDSFDHLDLTREAVLGERCGSGSCPPIFLAANGRDWTHGNSVQLAPDGALLYSSRHQDWLVKIDYNSGAGSGAVLWRLGKDGDFQIDSDDPNPWFSHQHDAQFIGGDASTILVFDDGNIRRGADPNANSRGQVLRLDEANRVAHLTLNADLGGYSFALGAAQLLANGNYHFDNGWLPDDSSMAVEVDTAGAIVYSLQVAEPEYRSFRLTDLYGSDSQ